ncbi:UNVERIFIED_CONTAM: hypothetical protein Sradi_0940200 [Sesamum radiatum]|uniref:Uncharacterized protein n=1 Tax=Sesamum radiatum TaxID=300843 RepID=A0AAW2V3N9_SESRA
MDNFRIKQLSKEFRLPLEGPLGLRVSGCLGVKPWIDGIHGSFQIRRGDWVETV